MISLLAVEMRGYSASALAEFLQLARSGHAELSDLRPLSGISGNPFQSRRWGI